MEMKNAATSMMPSTMPALAIPSPPWAGSFFAETPSQMAIGPRIMPKMSRPMMPVTSEATARPTGRGAAWEGSGGGYWKGPSEDAIKGV